jgi:heme oxygenase
MAANIKIQKIVKNSKMKRFNGNGYLQGIRHAAPYGDHFGLHWWSHLEKINP